MKSTVSISVSDEEKKRIMELSQAKGVTMSEYLRFKIFLPDDILDKANIAVSLNNEKNDLALKLSTIEAEKNQLSETLNKHKSELPTNGELILYLNENEKNAIDYIAGQFSTDIKTLIVNYYLFGFLEGRDRRFMKRSVRESILSEANLCKIIPCKIKLNEKEMNLITALCKKNLCSPTSLLVEKVFMGYQTLGMADFIKKLNGSEREQYQFLKEDFISISL